MADTDLDAPRALCELATSGGTCRRCGCGRFPGDNSWSDLCHKCAMLVAKVAIAAVPGLVDEMARLRRIELAAREHVEAHDASVVSAKTWNERERSQKAWLKLLDGLRDAGLRHAESFEALRTAIARGR